MPCLLGQNFQGWSAEGCVLNKFSEEFWCSYSTDGACIGNTAFLAAFARNLKTGTHTLQGSVFYCKSCAVAIELISDSESILPKG